ncbi:MAG: M48 family metallopeptidase [Proteobacteria bacterium]|nr:M48 family metallopeptidase [Pseudomonadota bacterium]
MTTERRNFPGISPRAWEHPADRAALVALRKVPGFDLLVRKLFGFVGERALRLTTLATSVRVSETQFPDLWASYIQACTVLDIEQPPELYVAHSPYVNAGAVGFDEPFIVLNSASLALLSDEEVQFILAHELGHAMSGHVLYKTMLFLLMRLTIPMMIIPVTGAALLAIRTALLEWDRKSELSADRAGMLVVQDPELAMRVMMKMAGGGKTDQMNVDAFVQQADEYRSGGGVMDSVIKVINLLGRRHPFPVLRLAEMKAWVDSGDYGTIVGGDYPERNADDNVSVFAEIKAAGSKYGEDFDKSPDPLFGFVKNIGESINGLFKRKPATDE